MKKTSTFITALFILASTVNAQNKKNDVGSPTFKKDDKVINVSLGLGGGYGIPVQGSFEYGITKDIGVGAMVGYGLYKVSGITVNNILVGAKGNYHYQFVDKLDTYGSVILGYNVASVSGAGSNLGSYGGIFYSFGVGGRYYFKPKIAALAELGYGLANLNIGIAIKL
jgi:hypothetical protein